VGGEEVEEVEEEEGEDDEEEPTHSFAGAQQRGGSFVGKLSASCFCAATKTQRRRFA